MQRKLTQHLTRLACTTLLAALSGASWAQDKVTLLTNWYAQAEQGGFYQAQATGLYKKYGLDVTIKMGGPQVNGMQLLTAGQADFIMGYDFQTLNSIEKGLPVVTVAASFQKDLQGVLAHADVKGLDGLKGKTILANSSAQTSWLPWLLGKYGYTMDQVRPYTFNLQPFFADKSIAQSAYLSSEPFIALKANEPANFFLLGDYGYPPYGTTIVTQQKMVSEKPDVVARFVRASMEGWKSYLANPAPGNVLIKQDNPKMEDDLLAFAVKRLKEVKAVDGGDAATQGVGTMTDARWEQTYKFMVSAKLLKPDTDWKKAYTTQFVKDLKVMP